MALVSRRIASIYSSMVEEKPFPPAYLFDAGPVGLRSDYEASTACLDDRAYWRDNLPSEVVPPLGSPRGVTERDPYSPSAAVQLDPLLIRRINELSKTLGIRRISTITAVCGLVVRGLSGMGSEVVLDFPVSRRVHPESRVLPGMLAGVVPLVLTASPRTSVADFCRHVDTRLRELTKHQSFQAPELERTEVFRGSARRRIGQSSISFLRG